MAEGIALLAAYGEDADELDEEEEHLETAALPETNANTSEADQEKAEAVEVDESVERNDAAADRKGSEGAAQTKLKLDQNGALKAVSEQATGWKSPPEERRSPKTTRTPGASPMGSRAGSKSPLDVGRLGRSPLGQRMGLAGVDESEGHERALRAGSAEASGRGLEDEDDLADFMPPPPEGKCSDELQLKFARWVELLKQGRSFNESMRSSKPYRNPDFLAKVVAYHEIDEIGSCFAKDVFDPHGLPEEDFYDNLATAQRQEAEQREQEKRKLGKVDFVKGGVQPPAVAAMGPDGRPLSLASIPKVLTPPVAKVTPLPPAATAAAKVTDIRPGKRTKWDKVEDRSGLPPLDAVAVARERAAALSGGGSLRPTHASRK
ncbi:hypothetical protein KFL_001830100 [Klebsormidium nitens]|uniref:Uncharacterized protein n=1 Tax=Klebsormidium nitens TaxID=105231 RepID=A0A1Y1I2U4_KLENI|nr:hypothetical protein KFL_001830100 [Klebsormidium nitens]|eukprot:GAQ84282.1 hypothetical protein KFL_001830100 [Klebsormidium nitens]